MIAAPAGGSWLDQILWTEDGLVPAIAQDADTGRILMFAWMSRDSLRLTVETGQAVYWSRSRRSLWRKGESSGNVQVVRELRIDCDGDVLLMRVEQAGGVACHTGRESCFYRRLAKTGWVTVDDVLRDPAEMYGK